MYQSSVGALVLCLLLGVVLGTSTKLVYIEKPANTDSASFVTKITDLYDVRGDYGNFVLVVDHGHLFQANVVFSPFDDSVYSYFVAEAADLMFPVRKALKHHEFSGFSRVEVMGKYVFEVPKAREEEFTRAVPFDFEIVLVPHYPLPAPSIDAKFTAPGAPDPKIQNYISQVNSADLKAFVTYLTGEANGSPLQTRHSQSTGAVTAQNWLASQFTSFGFSTTTQAFRSGYSSNVVATLAGKTTPSKLVLVTAHYDDRAANINTPTERAPGANDNGSGTGALLQLAKLIYSNKISFEYTVVLIAFSGEEQGLYGSAYNAQQYKSTNADIVAVLNADMIAYRATNENPQLAFASRSSTPSLNTLLTNITKTYVAQLTVGTTTSCCTDHASYYNQGYTAASFFERNGAIADPQYHKSGDLVNRVGYDIELQYPLITRAVFASLLTIAKYQ